MDALLNWLWQGGVVAIAALGMLRLLDRARAAVRCLVCWVALIVVAVLPLVAFVMAVLSPSEPPAASAAIVTVPTAWWTSTVVMTGALLIWAGVYAVRFARAVVLVRRARARTRAFPPAVEPRLTHWMRLRTAGRITRLVVSDRVRAAAVFGCGEPVIAVAPALVDRLKPAELDRVVIHEWAHVQRRDDVAKLLQFVVRGVAGWHPAVSWLDRRLSIEQELACDEMVVAVGGGAKAYASCLVKLASLRTAQADALLAAGALSSAGLGRRVGRLLAPKTLVSPALSRTGATLVVALLCVLALGIAPVRFVEAGVSASLARVLRPAVQAEPAPAVTTGAPRPDDPPRGQKRRAAATRRSSEASIAHPQVAAAAADSQPQSVDDGGVIEELRHTAEPDTRRVEPAAPPLVTLPPPVPVAPPPVVNADSRSVWSPAADAGTAIGRGSKEAGLATAGAFTRFAKKIAGAF